MSGTVYLRRLIFRKRRCFLLAIFIFLISVVVYSWQQSAWPSEPLVPDEPAPVADIRVLTPVHPKYIVLEQPGPIPNSNINQNKEQKNEDHEKDKEKHDPSIPKEEPPKVNQMHPPPVAESKDMKDTWDVENVKDGKEVKIYKNGTEASDKVKNETLLQLGVIGEKDSEKRIPKIVYIKSMWNLTVSFEDIGRVMKDTAFLNKLKPLNLNGPMLMSTRNRTSNFSLSMPLKMGYCDCWERYCFCCVQIANEQLHLNNKTCANFTFISKSHELGIDFNIDGKKVYSGTISADAPPLLCLGSVPGVSDLCIHFFNMTYKVDRHGLHKSQILGCTDFTLNIYNKTLSVFPVDCFQIPGDPNHHRKEEHVILPNFVP